MSESGKEWNDWLTFVAIIIVVIVMIGGGFFYRQWINKKAVEAEESWGKPFYALTINGEEWTIHRSSLSIKQDISPNKIFFKARNKDGRVLRLEANVPRWPQMLGERIIRMKIQEAL